MSPASKGLYGSPISEPNAGAPKLIRNASHASLPMGCAPRLQEVLPCAGGLVSQQEVNGQVSVPVADCQEWAAAERDFGGGKLIAGSVRQGRAFQPQQRWRGGSGEGEHGGLCRDVLHLQVFHDGVLVQPVDYRLLLPGAGDQVDALSVVHDHQQVDDPPAVAGQDGGRPMPRQQVVHPVG